jgi:hypothetical protein
MSELITVLPIRNFILRFSGSSAFLALSSSWISQHTALHPPHWGTQPRGYSGRVNYPAPVLLDERCDHLPVGG